MKLNIFLYACNTRKGISKQYYYYTTVQYCTVLYSTVQYREETIIAIKTLSTCKAVVIDEIPIELFQQSPEATIVLHQIIVEVSIFE